MKREGIERYIELYHLYKNLYYDKRKYIYISAMLQGVCLEIRDEIMKYTAKHRKSPEAAENRLKIIEQSLADFDKLLNEHERQIELNNLLMCRNMEHERQIEELNKKLEHSELEKERIKNFFDSK